MWEGIETWDEVVRRWQEMHLRQPDGQTVGGILTLVKTVLKKHGNFPDAESLRARLPYLEALGRRLEPEGPIQKLRQLFADPLVARVWMIEVKDGRRYYLLNEPAQINFDYIPGFDINKLAKGHAMSAEVIYSGPAPQVALAKGLKGTLANMNADNWEASICTIVQAICADQSKKAMDPLLKATLLHKTLELGCQGSPSLQRGFGPHLEVLRKLNGGQPANWLDPKDADAGKLRPQVEADLANLPEIAAAAKLAGEDSAGLRACPARFYRWIGWLYRSQPGGWNCATAPGLKYSGRLCVVRHAAPRNKVVIEVIGRMENGAVTVTTSQTGTMVEGRPVYLDVPESGLKS